MRRRQFIPYLALQLAIGGSACTLTGCGTLFHGERRGQRHNGRIDWKIAALNGLGLVFFFVPGVIAFAIDFYTGAIYLPASYANAGWEADPASESSTVAGDTVPLQTASRDLGAASTSVSDSAAHSADNRLGLKRIQLTPDQLTPSQIERIVAQHVGQPVSLQSPEARLSQLTYIDEFDEQCQRHRSDREFGSAVRSFLSRWSPA